MSLDLGWKLGPNWPVFEAVTTSTSLHSCTATVGQTGEQPVSELSQSVIQAVSQSLQSRNVAINQLI